MKDLIQNLYRFTYRLGEKFCEIARERMEHERETNGELQKYAKESFWELLFLRISTPLFICLTIPNRGNKRKQITAVLLNEIEEGEIDMTRGELDVSCRTDSDPCSPTFVHLCQVCGGCCFSDQDVYLLSRRQFPVGCRSIEPSV